MSTPLKIAVSKVDITPRKPIPMCGWELRVDPYTKVASPLEANAILLEHDGNFQVYITIDVLFSTDKIKNHLLHEINANGIHIEEKDLLVIASHTHFAPNVDEEKPILGAITPEYLEFVNGQLSVLVNQLAGLELKACSIKAGQAMVDGNVNRRRVVRTFRGIYAFVHSKIDIGPNYGGPRNERLSTFEFMVENKAVAMLWNYACHPTNFHEFESISSDFIGDLRTEYQQSNNVPVLFLQGFTGNIRANTTPKGSFWDDLFGRKKTFDWLTKERYEAWISILSKGLNKALKNAKEVSTIDFNASRNEMPLTAIMTTSSEKKLGFQKNQFAEGYPIISMSAEPVSEYFELISKTIHSKQWIPVGYMDTVFGYLPINKMIPEGGYEVQGFFRPFSIEGAYKNQVQEPVINHIKELMNG